MTERIETISAGAKIAATIAITFGVLGLGCGIWLGFFRDNHAFHNELTQDQRRAENVGALTPPKSPVKLTIVDNTCVKIDKAEIDTENVLAYAENRCLTSRWFVSFSWKAYAPDRTIIGSGSGYIVGNESFAKDERIEFGFKVSRDPRIVEIALTTNGGRAPYRDQGEY